MNDRENTAALLDRTRHLLRGDNTRETRRALRDILLARRTAYLPARTLDRLPEYALYLCMALHAELDNEEEESIETAELAYLALTESLLQYPDTRLDMTRHRVFLLYRFQDYLADTWSDVFMQHQRQTQPLQARSTALDALSLMALSDVHELEREHPEQVAADNELNDIRNMIHLPIPPRDEDLSDASLMHKLLRTHLKTKYAL
ncbi:MAG: hypothetical protein LBG30_01670 [Odoribacteraceae bacterium]|jgi:hypothetical protein|nr:hypothetical protein [Odoribacteraceae bacterium]